MHQRADGDRNETTTQAVHVLSSYYSAHVPSGRQGEMEIRDRNEEIRGEACLLLIRGIGIYVNEKGRSVR